jgi:hypothetical protein
MQRARETRKTTAHRSTRVLAAGLAWALGLLLTTLTGCQSTPSTATAAPKEKDLDPLFGSSKVPDKTFGVADRQLPPQNRAQMGVGPPPAIASKSVAPLAYGEPLPGGKDLAIADNQKPATTAPMQQTGQWNPSGDRTQADPRVQLKQPDQAIVPVPPPFPNSSQAQPQTQLLPAATQAAFTDTDQLQAALKQRGVLWQDRKDLADGTHFLFGVANPSDPNVSRTYDVVAADYRAAALAVLRQLDPKN